MTAVISASLVGKWYIRPALVIPAARAADTRETEAPVRAHARVLARTPPRADGRWAGALVLISTTLPTGRVSNKLMVSWASRAERQHAKSVTARHLRRPGQGDQRMTRTPL